MNLQSLLNDGLYRQFVKTIRQKVRGLRRRGLIAALYRLMQEADPSGRFTGVEVGVKFGTLSQQILESLPQVRQMVLVDPWKEYPKDHSDRGIFSYTTRTQAGWDRMAEMCQRRMQPFGDKAVIMRLTSLDAAARFHMMQEVTRPFFVYIDAGHSYEDVLADCRAWWPIVQFGGCLCGDDFRPAGHKDRTESVSSAVEAFAAEHGLPVVEHHRNFFVQKPG